MNVKPTNNTGTGSFKDTISEKAVSEKIDYDERAFEYLGPNAPDEVRKAWMEAAKETGANGMGMGQHGKRRSVGRRYFGKYRIVCVNSSKTGTL